MKFVSLLVHAEAHCAKSVTEKEEPLLRCGFWLEFRHKVVRKNAQAQKVDANTLRAGKVKPVGYSQATMILTQSDPLAKFKNRGLRSPAVYLLASIL